MKDDTIRRQAAIDIVNKNRDSVFHDSVHYEDAVYGISNLPAAQPKPQWIPCSERLPEPRIDVWCNSDMGQMVGYYEENVETWYGRDYLELMVTAWMPLPEPYKRDADE